MSLIDVMRYRLRALLRPGSHASDIDDELQHHLSLEAMEARASARGTISDDEARFRARRQYGNTTWYTEERRMIAGLTVLDTARQDISFVVRMLRRRATFAAVTIITMALGIGAATSIYSVADAVLFRPLPFPEANRLATVWLNHPRWKLVPGLANRWDRGTIPMPAYRQWRDAQRSFTDVAAWSTTEMMAGEAGAAEEVAVGRATASLAHVLGIRPVVGSWFSEDDDVIGGAPVAVISHETWTKQFGSDSTIVGRILPLGGERYRIAGVAPHGLSLDRSANIVAYWIPAGRDSSNASMETAESFQAIGRLKPGVSFAAAALEAAAMFPRVAEDNRIEGATVTSLHDDQTRKVRAPLLILLAAAGLLLVIACINIATLLLGEATRRQGELRTRAALGAGRMRLVRQLLTESLVLAGAGAMGGVLLAFAATKVIVHAAPPSTPGLADVGVNVHVLLVALIAAVTTGVLFGLAPALSLSRAGQSLALGNRNTARGHGRGQRVLIACEVALSMVLLVGAGLLVRSFDKLSSVGFRPDGLTVASLRLPRSPYDDSVHTRLLYANLVSRIRRLPGVEDVAATTTPPFSAGSSSGSFEVEGRPRVRGAQAPDAQRRVTTPEFFRVAGIPIVEGRGYSDADRNGSTLVVVVNRTLAKSEWPGESAIGKRVKFNGWRTVIGVAGDIATERPTANPPEAIYLPLAQMMLRGTPALLVRMNAANAESIAALRRAVREVDDVVRVSRVDATNDLVAQSLADDRLRTVLITLFAAIAAVLAAVGTYGVASTAATRRTREMAIRVAVGASGASIARLIVSGAAAGVGAGALVGAGLAIAGARMLSPYLYGVRPTDPLVYAAVALLLAMTTAVATWVPARRAMRVRVADALTAE